MFANRVDAGRQLAEKLNAYRDRDVVVCGIPRGGVIVAKVVADEFGAPLDLVIARKIGHPASPEYGIGAVTDDGYIALNPLEPVAKGWLEEEAERQRLEAHRRRAAYLADRNPIPLAGCVAILIDDGIATGYTVEAAIGSLRARDPEELVLAVPVVAPQVVARFERLADRFVFVAMPMPFYGVGQFYENFEQVSDDQVLESLKPTT